MRICLHVMKNWPERVMLSEREACYEKQVRMATDTCFIPVRDGMPEDDFCGMTRLIDFL